MESAQLSHTRHTPPTDIDTWYSNVEQHASEGVDKILVGNKRDWADKRAVSEDDGQRKAEELGISFIETSAKDNENVEKGFFDLARFDFCATSYSFSELTVSFCRAIKTRLIDSQTDASTPGGSNDGQIKVNQPISQGTQQSCCT